MTDPFTAVLAVARPVLVKGGAMLTAKIRTRATVVWRVRSRARQRGFDVKARALYSWLKSQTAKTLLESPGLDGVPLAVNSLHPIIRVREVDDALARQVLEWTLYEWTRAIEPSAAIALRGDITDQHVIRESEATRELLLDVASDLRAGKSLEENLAELHPWRAAEARILVGSWPQMTRVISQLANSTDPAELLDQWHRHPPEWLGAAPADVLAWLGTLSSDYHSTEAAVAFCASAVAAGASDRGYIIALHAMAQSRLDVDAARELLASSGQDHPLCTALAKLMDNQPARAETVLEAWSPAEPHKRAIRALVLAQCRVERDDLAGAIAILEALNGADESSGVAMAVAQYRLARAVGTSTINTIAEANRSLALAIRARDHRRKWRGPSQQCVLVAARAACLTGDADLAWRICQPQPEGEATFAESNDPEVRSEAGLIAALSRRTSIATSALDTIDDAFRVAEIRAMLAAEDGKNDDAVGHWQTAWEAATTDADRMVAARGIAELGGELPDLSVVSEEFADKVSEIRMLGAAMRETGETRLERLRAGATQAPVLAVQLAAEYRAIGEPSAAGEALKHAAETWPHASLWSMAAESFRNAGDWDSAIDCAHRAIAAGGTGWSGERQCRVLMLEVYAGSGALDRALEEARTLTSADPSDISAQWAHVKCAVRRALLNEAWTELTRTTPPAAPRDPNEVGIWVSLHARFAADGRWVTKALRYANDFPDDAALRGGVLGQIYGRPHSETQKLTEQELKELHEATAAFTERFPDNEHFRSVKVDLENPLEALTQLAGDAPKADPEFVKNVRTGDYPIGMLTALGGRTYLEILVQCRGAIGIAHRDRARSVGSAPGTRVRVLDTSAAVTLAGLDESTREVLIGLSQSLASTDETLRDCVRGAESFGPARTMSVGWSEAGDGPTITEITEQQAEAQAVLAQTACEIVRRTHRVPWPELKTLSSADGDELPFLLAVDLAATRGQELWVDDAMLARIAQELGCTTVSTFDVVRDAVAAGRFSTAAYEQVLGQLIHAGYLNPPFETPSVVHAAELSGWRPEGAARFLAQGEAWADPEKASAFALLAMEHAVAASAADLQAWVFAATLGVARASLTDAQKNHAVLLGRIMSESWCDASKLLFVLNGSRQTTAELGTNDPVEIVLRARHKALLQRFDHATAGAMMVAFGSALGETDKALIARIVLTSE